MALLSLDSQGEVTTVLGVVAVTVVRWPPPLFQNSTVQGALVGVPVGYLVGIGVGAGVFKHV